MNTELIIIGAGPAGLTAGLYAARAGVKAVVFEGNLVGGQASTTNIIENYPGFNSGIGGPELMMSFEEQAKKFGLEIKYESVKRVDLANKKVITRKDEYTAKAIIIAGGAQRRKLGVPGEDALTGRGISYCATCDGALYRGKSVCVVGGGATAIEDAEYLSAYSSVTVIHRRDSLRADEASIKRVMNDKNVSFIWNSVVTGVSGDDGELTLELSNTVSGDKSRVKCAGCFVAIGTQPVSELYEGQLEMRGGYIAAHEDTKTSLEGVFAAGDIREKPLRQVLTAASDGAVAAYEAAKYIRSM